MTPEEDYNIKKGKYHEDIADGHMVTREWRKAAVLYKKAFNAFKKAGDKDSCLRVKEKFDKAMANLKSEEGG